VDAVARGADVADRDRVRADLLRASLAYTRGFSDGFLGGSDHQTLVEGRFPKHRGVPLGRVVRVLADGVLVERDDEVRPWTGGLAADARRTGPEGAPVAALRGLGGSGTASDGPAPAPIEVRAGMGVVFDAGQPEDQAEPGGPVFRVDATPHGWRLGFGRPGPDLTRRLRGQRVWVTSDPLIAREAERVVGADEPSGRVPMTLTVRGREGAPLEVEARAAHATASAASAMPLVAATGAGLDDALVREKLGATGGTPLRLEALDLAGLAPGLHLPVSELKTLRRRVVDELVAAIERGPSRAVVREPVLPALLTAASVAPTPAAAAAPPPLLPLCRQDAQLEAVIDAGLPEVELDWMEMVGLAKAVARARTAGLRVTLATVRVQKPGEEGYDRRLEALDPDAVLVRHWGALVHFQEAAAQPAAGAIRRPLLHGDFSLNVTNSIAAAELLRRGLDTLTVSHDLDLRQLTALLDARPRPLHGGAPPRMPTPSTASTRTCCRPAATTAAADGRARAPALAPRRQGPRAPGHRRRRLPQHRLPRRARERGGGRARPARARRASLPGRVRPRDAGRGPRRARGLPRPARGPDRPPRGARAHRRGLAGRRLARAHERDGLTRPRSPRRWVGGGPGDPAVSAPDGRVRAARP
jgi:putative protease